MPSSRNVLLAGIWAQRMIYSGCLVTVARCVLFGAALSCAPSVLARDMVSGRVGSHIGGRARPCLETVCCKTCPVVGHHCRDRPEKPSNYFSSQLLAQDALQRLKKRKPARLVRKRVVLLLRAPSSDFRWSANVHFRKRLLCRQFMAPWWSCCGCVHFTCQLTDSTTKIAASRSPCTSLHVL